MTGFLHRLAARALGVTRPLRSTAAAGVTASLERPDVPVPEDVMTPISDAGTVSPRRTHGPTGPGRIPVAPAWLAAAAGGIDPAAAPESPAARPFDRDGSLGRSEPAHPQAATAGTSIVAAVTAAREAVRRSDADDDRRSPGVAPPPPTEGWQPMWPLLPEAARIPAAAVRERTPLAFRLAESSRPEPEGTEVHVTIGRIEVTAAPERPVPKRKAGPRSAPMSLDQYLARRQQGTP